MQASSLNVLEIMQTYPSSSSLKLLCASSSTKILTRTLLHTVLLGYRVKLQTEKMSCQQTKELAHACLKNAVI